MMHGAMATPSRRLRMVQLDVFASRPLQGNPLAVFLDGRGLSDAEMQALAREMNLSETTFVLPRDAETERTRGVRVRIFTVQEEIPFAGHPTLGTAFALRAERGGDEVALELGVGLVPVRFEARADGQPFGEMTSKPQLSTPRCRSRRYRRGSRSPSFRCVPSPWRARFGST
jgi:trans-2,3-dihydro-3-hydroxyanthranilate isomerase